MNNVIPLRSDTATLPAGPVVYSVAQVADLLGLSLGLAYSLVRDGTIPARKLGSRWVIPVAAFHTWLNSATEHAERDVS